MGTLEVAVAMSQAGLSDRFIITTLYTAYSYEGISDLVTLWVEESDLCERNEIIAEIEDLLRDLDKN